MINKLTKEIERLKHIIFNLLIIWILTIMGFVLLINYILGI